MVKIALNHALMIETIRAKGRSNEEIIELLKEGKSENFSAFGNGIPDWDTFINYYNENKEKISKALLEKYEVTFLTKGALKSLLRIKYNLVEGTDFEDKGESLDEIKLSEEQLKSLQTIISKNWMIHKVSPVDVDTSYVIKIELANQTSM
ncbi:hypothetical protein ACXYMX_16595 [Sporosarcina sp. CAU 1771]